MYFVARCPLSAINWSASRNCEDFLHPIVSFRLEFVLRRRFAVHQSQRWIHTDRNASNSTPVTVFVFEKSPLRLHQQSTKNKVSFNPHQSLFISIHTHTAQVSWCTMYKSLYTRTAQVSSYEWMSVTLDFVIPGLRNRWISYPTALVTNNVTTF